jgi:hypothetical protein
MLAAFIFFVIPTIAEIFFAGSLISFIVAKSRNKRDPGFYNDEEMKNKRNLLIISSTIFGFFATVMIVLIAILYTAVAFM